MTPNYKKYAELLIRYCVDLQPGERLFVQSTTLAEPLLRELYRAALQAGGHCEFDLQLEGQQAIFYEASQAAQLAYVPTLYSKAMTAFEAYIYIQAPHSLSAAAPAAEKVLLRQAALRPYQQLYFQRSGDGRMKRSLCLFPCAALAEAADMSLAEYTDFVFAACKLDQADPKAAWLAVRAKQQKIVDYLNSCTEFRYRNSQTDIRFTTRGRQWINSDGRTNMPSGEVYTSPEEDSVEGEVYFDYPAIRDGRIVQGVRLSVRQGEIIEWKAEQGQEVLDETFQIPGSRRFGEAAIGTNYDINRFTKNILFDEKIGGTIHLAIGQSYIQCGGKNESSVHWDMIADMTQDGEITADGKTIYRQGHFLIE